jgi:ATP-dependent RNA helicase DDX41
MFANAEARSLLNTHHLSIMAGIESAPKRRRISRSPSPAYKLDDEDDNYVPYVPVAQRREAKLAKLSSLNTVSDRTKAKKQLEELLEREDAEREEERQREKARKERPLLMEAQEVHERKAAESAHLTKDWSV